MKFWKIYFWLLVTFNAIFILFVLTLATGMFYELSRELDSSFDLEMVFEIVFSLIILVPIYGISYRKKIFDSLSWKVVLAVQFIYVLNLYFDMKPDLISDPFSPYTLSVLIALLIFGIPTIIANYLYAFKSDAIWQTSN